MKKILLCAFAISFFTTQISANDYSNNDGGETTSENGGFSISADYLYWNAVQDQMQYAAVLPGGVQGVINQVGDGSPVNVIDNLSLIDPSFEYQSGFRIGIGYQVPCSNWDCQLSWVRLHENLSSSVSELNGGVIPLASPVSSLFGFIDSEPMNFGFGSTATSHWKFEFDTLDLQIGRLCTFSYGLQMRPYIGIKAASIRQKQHIQYLGFALSDGIVNIETIKKNDFRGIGPSFGMDASWEFFPHFNLTSGICGSLLYGKFDVHVNPFVSQLNNSINITLKNSKKNRLRPTVDANIGIEWQDCLCGKFPVRIGVAYEAQYWWNQWLVPSSVISSIIGGSSPQGDLMLSGLTVNAEIGF